MKNFFQIPISAYLFLLLGIVPFFSVSALTRYADDAQIAEWAWESVYSMRENGIITGFEDNTFKPNQTINRAQALTIIARTIPLLQKRELVKANPRENFFKDITPGAWYYDAVLIGIKESWVKGYPDGTMQPARTLSMAEWATMLARAFDMQAQEDLNTFEDVQTDDWFYDASQAMLRYGLVRGAKIKFNPHTEVTRAQAAWMMDQILKRPEFQQWYIDQQAQLEQQNRLKKMFAVNESWIESEDQGFEPIETGLEMIVAGSEGSILLNKGQYWSNLGRITLKNDLEDLARLQSIDFGVIKTSGFLEEEQFMIKIENPNGGFEKTITMDKDGKTEALGLAINVNPGQTVRLDISIKINETARVRDASASVQVLGGEATINKADVYEGFLPLVREGTILGYFETKAE